MRIGGALGGDHPEETLLQGTIAIFSNSGGFTTTIAQYLSTEGWGTTTLVSSGKDVYIHYAARDFAHALRNDGRSRAAVLYSEPGGYYEQDVDFGKPVVACVVGRWKTKLTRAVGHAGAMAGSGDSAEDKERWFMEAFGVDAIFTPENPVVSKKGAVVTNIAHIPAALTAVMAASGARPDFAPRGSLTLKPWMANDQGIELPRRTGAAAGDGARALCRTDRRRLPSQVGAVIARQNMKDRSGASQMDPKTQVTSVHGHSVLELALQPLQANFALPLVHEAAGPNDRAMLDIAVAAEVNLVGDPILVAVDAAREAGNSPNTVMAAAAAIVGPKRVERALACTRALIDLFAGSGLQEGHHVDFDRSRIQRRRRDARAVHGSRRRGGRSAPRGDAEGGAARAAAKSVFLDFLLRLDGRLSRDAILAAIATTIAWGPLMRKRISRLTAETLPWYLRLYGVMVGATIPAEHHQWGMLARHLAGRTLRFVDDGRPVLPGDDRQEAERRAGAAAADPDRPADLQRAGLDLGAGRQGRGLRRRPADAGPCADQQGDGRLPHAHRLQPRRQRLRGHGVPAASSSRASAEGSDRPAARPRPEGDGDGRLPSRTRPKSAPPRKRGRSCARLPGVHHPVFKGKPVNHDPRERFIAAFMAERGSTTSSTRSTASWCRRCTTSARRPTCSASTSTP